ncbi:MAG: TIGR03936 family radical SAM-associated protein [Chloroflexota bacterium]
MTQRLRVTFSRSGEAKYISHLDMVRFWERAFRRAHLAVARSQGFHPHPRIAMAAPLPVGVTADAELMDVYLEEPIDPLGFYHALAAQLVPSIRVSAVAEASNDLPSLQASMRFAEYRVMVETERTPPDIRDAIAAILGSDTVMWEHQRDGETRRYDLRSQIAELALEGCENGVATLNMRLQMDGTAAGRPEQVARALGFEDPPLSVNRTRLILAEENRAAPATIAGGKASP